MSIEYIIGTALAAFFASLAAVAVTWLLNRASQRRDARAEVLRAIARHVDRLWTYSTAHSDIRTAGIGNGATFNGNMAPFKPPMTGLLTEVQAAVVYLPRSARPALVEVQRLIGEAEVPSDERSRLADWKGEATAVGVVGARVASWDGKSSRLPG